MSSKGSSRRDLRRIWWATSTVKTCPQHDDKNTLKLLHHLHQEIFVSRKSSLHKDMLKQAFQCKQDLTLKAHGKSRQKLFPQEKPLKMMTYNADKKMFTIKGGWMSKRRSVILFFSTGSSKETEAAITSKTSSLPWKERKKTRLQDIRWEIDLRIARRSCSFHFPRSTCNPRTLNWNTHQTQVWLLTNNTCLSSSEGVSHKISFLTFKVRSLWRDWHVLTDKRVWSKRASWTEISGQTWLHRYRSNVNDAVILCSETIELIPWDFHGNPHVIKCPRE